MILPVTLSIAAALAIFNAWLAIRVIRVRVGSGVLNGTGDDPAMALKIRAQANLVEYAPFFLILLGGIELAGGSPTWLWIAGLAFVFARIAHAVGIGIPRSNVWRAAGALTTLALLLLMAGWAIATVYAARDPGGAIVVAPASATA